MNGIDDYIAHLVDAVEGPQFTDNPADVGGPTKYGITQRTLGGYRGKPATVADVRNLTRQEAVRIYEAQYIDAPGFRPLVALSLPVAAEVIDTGVNVGVAVATRFLQTALNVLNRQGRDYADISVDGICGPRTVGALSGYLRARPDGEAVLLTALNCMQGARYIQLAEARQANEGFVYGWLRARVMESAQ